MEKLFINIFNMSISASYLVFAVLIVRFFLRKAPKNDALFFMVFGRDSSVVSIFDRVCI